MNVGKVWQKTQWGLLSAEELEGDGNAAALAPYTYNTVRLGDPDQMNSFRQALSRTIQFTSLLKILIIDDLSSQPISGENTNTSKIYILTSTTHPKTALPVSSAPARQLLRCKALRCSCRLPVEGLPVPYESRWK